jgi:hypothetical protein
MRTVTAILAFIGASVLNAWLQGLGLSAWILIPVGVASYLGVVLIAWWPRWRAACVAAWRAFWSPDSFSTWPSPLKPAALSAAERDARQKVVVLVRAHGERAFSQLAALIKNSISLLRKGYEDCEHTLADLLDRELEQHQATASRLTTAINAADKQQHSSEDIQRLFGEFYRSYQGATTRLNDIGHVLGSPPQSLDRYREWRDTDAEFLRQLNHTIAYDGMEVLRGEVQAVGWGESQRPQQL